MDTDDRESLSSYHISHHSRPGQASSNVFSSPARGTYDSDAFTEELAKIGQSDRTNNQSQPEVQSELENLREENETLRLYASRCEEELRQYQLRFPELLEEVALSYSEHVDPAIAPWIASSDVLNPLLVAYEHRILALSEARHAAERDLAAARDEVALVRVQLDAVENELTQYQSLRPFTAANDPLALEQEELLRAKVGVLERANAELASQVEKLVPERDALRRQVTEERRAGDDAREQLRTSTNVQSQMKRTIAVLTSELQVARERAADGERVRDAYSLLEKRLDNSVARVSALEDELGREHENTRELQAQLQSVSRTRNELTGDVDAMVANLRELEASLHSAREREVQLLDQVAAAETLRDEKAREAAALAQTIASRDSELERAAAKFEADLNAADALHREERDELTRKHQTRVHILESELAECQNRLSAALTDLDLTRRALAGLETQVRQTRADQEMFRRETAQTVAEAAAAAVEFESRAKDSEEREERVERAWREDTERLTREIAVLTEETVKLRESSQRMGNDWRASESRVSALRAEIAQLKAESASTQALLDAKVASATRQLEQARTMHNREVSQLRERLVEAETTTEKLVGEARLLVRQQEEMSTAVRVEHKAAMQALRSELVSAIDDLNEVRTQLLHERSRRKQAELDLTRIQENYARERAEAERLRVNISECTAGVEEERRRRVLAESSAANAQTDLHRLSRANAALEAQIAALRTQKAALLRAQEAM